MFIVGESIYSVKFEALSSLSSYKGAETLEEQNFI